MVIHCSLLRNIGLGKYIVIKVELTTIAVQSTLKNSDERVAAKTS